MGLIKRQRMAGLLTCAMVMSNVSMVQAEIVGESTLGIVSDYEVSGIEGVEDLVLGEMVQIERTTSAQVEVEVQDGGGTLNASDLEVTSALTESKTYNGFTLMPGISIDTNNKNSDEEEKFTKRIKLNGTVKSTEKSIYFETQGPATLTIYAMSASDKSDRQLQLYDAKGAIEGASITALGVVENNIINKQVINIPQEGTYYIGSVKDGINIYKLMLEEGEGGGEEVKPERLKWSDVEAPSISEVNRSSSKKNTLEVDFDGVIGTDGADEIVAKLYNESGDVVSEAAIATEGVSGMIELPFLVSGNYTVQLEATREGELDIKASNLYELEFIRTELPEYIVISSAVMNSEGVVTVRWEPIEEIEHYAVAYKVAGSETYIEVVSDLTETSYKIEQLDAKESYTIKVTATRGDETVEGTIDTKAEVAIEKKWASANVGSGAKGSVTKNSDSSITINATGGKMADSEDGFTYYYTEMDPETENFTLTASFYLDNVNNVDNQSGFGIIALDTLVADNTAAKYYNSAGAMFTKFSTTINGVVSSKYGFPGGRFITGYTDVPNDPGAMGARKHVDSSVFDPEFKDNEVSGTDLEAKPRFYTGETYTLTLRKSNTGFHAYMSNDQTNEVICYEPELLLKQDQDKYYVGFFASRNVKLTVNDIELTITHPEDDEAKVERPVNYIEPMISYDATTTTSSGDYEAAFKTNVVGTITVQDSSGTTVGTIKGDSQTRAALALTIEEGTSSYTATFTPSPREEQNFTIYEELTSYEPVSIPFEVSYKYFGTSENALYVSPTGKATGIGNKKQPLDIYTAIAYAQPGQQIVLLGGTYELTEPIIINRGHSGKEDAPIVLMSDPNERAILDFSKSSSGFTLKGDYWHFYGFDICNAKKSPIRINGHHNIAEKLKIYNNKDTGLQISGFSAEPSSMWPSHNLVLSCESYNNADELGNDADGFAAKLTVGEGNVFRYCISHHNVDDGWDLYAKSTTGPIGQVVIDSCVTYANGSTEQAPNVIGEGNGFKLGGESIPGNHILRNSISFANIAKGITSNSGPDCELYDNTSYKNGAENVSLYTNGKQTNFVIENMVAYKQGKKDKYAFTNQDWQNDGSVYIDGSNGAGSKVADNWFSSLDTTIKPVIREDGSIDMQGLLELTNVAEGKGAVLTTNSNPTVIEIGKEIDAQLQYDQVEIIEAEGWLESASVTWKAVKDATGYEVYYKEVLAADTAYQLLDNSLIREYPTYFRADAIGLPQGSYLLKVVPVFEEERIEESKAITNVITVEAHTREGFAFSKESPMGTGSGGYHDDGSIPKNAQVVYITADTVNKIQLEVIKDAKGNTEIRTGLADILAGRQKGYDQRPLIIRMVGTIKDTDIAGLNSSGYIQLKGIYNTTFEGVGEDATAYGWGFLIRDAHNVELRNIGIMLFKDDAISLDTNNENIWVHNNDIFYGTAGGDSDQAKGDGSCDVKGFSNYVTISYNHFWDAGKSSLCGMSDSKEFFVTYHHNWYDHSDSRHPRIRVGSVHIYNNYFDGNSKYGVGITKGGSAFVEANDFRNCKYPMLISLQGSDVADGNEGTFSGEAGGIIKAYNNQIVGASRLVYQTGDAKEFDAYLANSRDESVSSDYKSVSGGNTYNNFDIAASMYAYTPHAPEDVREVVTTYAGRVKGGDFTWEFTEADDTDYSVNQALMAKIKAYKSQVVAIGGNVTTPPVEPGEPGPGEPGPGEPGGGGGEDITVGTATHNFTEQGKVSEYFTITGNLSTDKGSVVYNGMTLTQCLKLETATKITFKTNKAAKLTLVLDEGFAKSVKINDVKKQATNGILTVELEAGTHTITKGDTANLFYMIVDEEKSGEGGSQEEQDKLDQEAAAKVDAVIEALPSAEAVTKEDKAQVEVARAAYVALTEAQKGYVKATSLAKLEAVEKAIEALEQEEVDKEEQDKLDQEAAAKIDAVIEALPSAEAVTKEDKAQVEAARAAYVALTEAQKGYVKADSLAKLEAVEKAIEALEQEEVDKEEQDKLDQEAAAKVDAVIEALPSVEAVTKEDKAQVEAARAAYVALTEVQKGYVKTTSLAKLEAVEKAIEALEQEEADKEEQDKLDQEAAAKVDAVIEALPSAEAVTKEDKAQVEVARAAYVALTEVQKGYVKASSIAKLEAVETALKALDQTGGDTSGGGSTDDEEPGTPGNAGGGGSGTTNPVVPNTDSVIQNAIETGKAPVINMENGTITLSQTNLESLMNQEVGVTVVASDKVTITLPVETLKEQGKESVTLDAAKPSEVMMEAINQYLVSEDKVKGINENQLAIEVNVSHTESVQAFNEPIILQFAVSSNEAKNINSLTAVRYDVQADGTVKMIKIGGSYNATEGVYTFLSDKPGTFGLVEVEGLVKVNLEVGNTLSNINGASVANDVAPEVVNERVMVPVRFIAETLGAKVGWKSGRVTITLDDQEISFKVGESLDGYNVTPYIKGDRTYISTRWVAEQLEANILWVPSTKCIEIVR